MINAPTSANTNIPTSMTPPRLEPAVNANEAIRFPRTLQVPVRGGRGSGGVGRQDQRLMRQARRQHDEYGRNPTEESNTNRNGQVEILARKAPAGIRADEAVGPVLADRRRGLRSWQKAHRVTYWS